MECDMQTGSGALNSHIEDGSCLLTETQLARRWGMSPRTLQALRAQGKHPRWLKIGRCIRYRVSDIQTFESAASGPV